MLIEPCTDISADASSMLVTCSYLVMAYTVMASSTLVDLLLQLGLCLIDAVGDRCL